MDALSRQLSRAAAEKEDVERGRHTLLDSLRNTEQVRPLSVFDFCIFLNEAANLHEDQDDHHSQNIRCMLTCR